jgi:hypothetical protein
MKKRDIYQMLKSQIHQSQMIYMPSADPVTRNTQIPSNPFLNTKIAHSVSMDWEERLERSIPFSWALLAWKPKEEKQIMEERKAKEEKQIMEETSEDEIVTVYSNEELQLDRYESDSSTSAAKDELFSPLLIPSPYSCYDKSSSQQLDALVESDERKDPPELDQWNRTGARNIEKVQKEYVQSQCLLNLNSQSSSDELLLDLQTNSRKHKRKHSSAHGSGGLSSLTDRFNKPTKPLERRGVSKSTIPNSSDSEADPFSLPNQNRSMSSSSHRSSKIVLEPLLPFTEGFSVIPPTFDSQYSIPNTELYCKKTILHYDTDAQIARMFSDDEPIVIPSSKKATTAEILIDDSSDDEIIWDKGPKDLIQPTQKASRSHQENQEEIVNLNALRAEGRDLGQFANYLNQFDPNPKKTRKGRNVAAPPPPPAKKSRPPPFRKRSTFRGGFKKGKKQ